MIIEPNTLHAFESLDLTMKNPAFEGFISAACAANEWFTPHDIRYAVQAISDQMLQSDKLSAWLAPYTKSADFRKRRVGIVMAGNIPMVGFFDLLATLACGHSATVKLSSKDTVLMGFAITTLANSGIDVEVTASLDRYDVDAVIVTGSDATVELYRKRFEGLPAVFRGSRHSLAIVTPESANDADFATRLLQDATLYHGLGCRSITHILLPQSCSAEVLAALLRDQSSQCNLRLAHHKYAQAYRYQRAMASLHDSDMAAKLDCGCLQLRSSSPANVPAMGEVGYSFYDPAQPEQLIKMLRELSLQCVVTDPQTQLAAQLSKAGYCTVAWGESQRPALSDYADNIDLPAFLLQ